MAVPDPNTVEHLKISAIGSQAVVPAGTFEDCVLVESTGHLDAAPNHPAGTMTTTWTYAPHVGLVKFSTRFAPDDKGPPQEVSKMELVKYQVKATE